MMRALRLAFGAAFWALPVLAQPYPGPGVGGISSGTVDTMARSQAAAAAAAATTATTTATAAQAAAQTAATQAAAALAATTTAPTITTVTSTYTTTGIGSAIVIPAGSAAAGGWLQNNGSSVCIGIGVAPTAPAGTTTGTCATGEFVYANAKDVLPGSTTAAQCLPIYVYAPDVGHQFSVTAYSSAPTTTACSSGGGSSGSGGLTIFPAFAMTSSAPGAMLHVLGNIPTGATVALSGGGGNFVLTGTSIRVATGGVVVAGPNPGITLTTTLAGGGTQTQGLTITGYDPPPGTPFDTRLLSSTTLFNDGFTSGLDLFHPTKNPTGFWRSYYPDRIDTGLNAYPYTSSSSPDTAAHESARYYDPAGRTQSYGNGGGNGEAEFYGDIDFPSNGAGIQSLFTMPGGGLEFIAAVTTAATTGNPPVNPYNQPVSSAMLSHVDDAHLGTAYMACRAASDAHQGNWQAPCWAYNRNYNYGSDLEFDANECWSAATNSQGLTVAQSLNHIGYQTMHQNLHGSAGYIITGSISGTTLTTTSTLDSNYPLVGQGLTISRTNSTGAIAAGTTVTAQLTANTFTVSISQTVASEQIFVTPGYPELNKNIATVAFPGCGDAFHDYATFWNPAYVMQILDGRVRAIYPNPIFKNVPMYILSDLAVPWFNGNFAGYFDPAMFPIRMYLDYIKVVTPISGSATQTPSAPLFVMASPASGQIGFTMQDNYAVPAVTSRNVYCSTGGGAATVRGTYSGSNPPSGTTYISGFTDGVAASCYATATNSIGEGPASPTYTVTPPGPPSSVPAGHISLVSATTTSLTLANSGGGSGGSSVDSYIWQVKKTFDADPNAWVTFATVPDTRNVTVTGLDASGTVHPAYNVRVISHNNTYGDSAPNYDMINLYQ